MFVSRLLCPLSASMLLLISPSFAAANPASVRATAQSVITVLNGILSTVEHVDKTRDIIEKWSKEWRERVDRQRQEIERLEGVVRELKVPAKRSEIESFARQMKSLVELVAAERAALSERQEKVQGEVDQCLRDKKALFRCDALFSQIQLAAFRDALVKLQETASAKLRRAETALKR